LDGHFHNAPRDASTAISLDGTDFEIMIPPDFVSKMVFPQIPWHRFGI
jgi:hypothetical protein